MHTLLTSQIRFVRELRTNIVWIAASYFVLSILLNFSKGPIYFALFLIFDLVFFFFVFRDLGISFFRLFIFSLVIGTPFFSGQNLLVQHDVYFKYTITIPLSVEIPYRFVILFFFLFYQVVTSFRKKKQKNSSPVAAISFLIICGIICFLTLAQLFGNYPLHFQWPFWHLIQIFLTFPVLVLFLYEQSDNVEKITIVKNVFFAFVISTLFLQGVFSIGQYVFQMPLGLKMEKPFSVENIRAPENELFRSAGTLGHPNYLAVITSTLLPIGFYISRYILRKNNFVKISLGLGLVALILSFSRWGWFSFSAGVLFLLFFDPNYFAAALTFIRKNLKFYFLPACVFVSLILFRFQAFSTTKGRLDSAKTFLKMINQEPVWGVGPENSLTNVSAYNYNYDKYIGAFKGAHNTLLLLFADNGVVVGILFILFCLLCISVSASALRSRKKSTKKFFVFLITSLLVLSLNTLFYPIYTFDANLELFFVLSSFLIVFYSFSTNLTPRNER